MSTCRPLGSIWFTVVVLAVGCASPPGPGGAGPGGPAGGGAPSAPTRITAAVNSNPSALNNMLGAAAGSAPGMEALGAMVNSGLTIVDHQGNTRGLLAQDVPTVENGLWRVLSDGRMEITWKIRPGVEWHDGRPFTADDILFTYTLEEDANLAIFSHSIYKSIDGIEAPDPMTLVTRWRRPYIYANLAFGYDGDRSLLPLPRHLLEKPYIDNKDNVDAFINLPYWTADFVGTGPYKLKEWVGGSHAVFQANDRYPLGRPKVDEIEVKFIPDVNTLLANMLSGTVDVNVGRGLTLQESRQILERVEGSKADNAIIGAFTVYPQFLNPNPPILANVQFRRALLHAINRQEMIDSLAFGQSSIAHTFIHPGESDYAAIEPSIVKYEYDPARASRIIEGLGYTRGADGIFRDPAGQRLSVEIRSGRDTEQYILTVADYWQRVGIGPDAVVIPPQRDRDVEYRATFPGTEMVRRGNYRWDLKRVLSTAESPTAETRFQGGNRGRYMNADLDVLLDRYDLTIPLPERSRTLGQIITHVSDQAVLLGLFYGIDGTVYAKRLHNVHGKYERTTQAWNIHEWEVR